MLSARPIQTNTSLSCTIIIIIIEELGWIPCQWYETLRKELTLEPYTVQRAASTHVCGIIDSF
jgi:hypothetical protein